MHSATSNRLFLSLELSASARDPQLIERDRRDGYITEEFPAREYGYWRTGR